MGGELGIVFPELRFVHDGDKLVEEYNGSGGWLRAYIHGPGTDEPLVWYDFTAGFNRYFLHADQQGSVVALADLYGSATTINGYDPWGIPNAGNQGRFQYTGQAWIAELGMYYYKARIYSPTLGRFLQTDPVGYKDQMNLYAYVGNDPVNNADPTGTTCTSSQVGDKTVYSCRIDSVAVVERGRVVGVRPPTEAENRRFAGFNTRYTAAVNRLANNPDRSVRVVAIQRGQGAFRITAGQASAALASRQFIYAGTNLRAGTDLSTAGLPNPQTGLVTDARTYVSRDGLSGASQAGIVHDGFHSTPQEATGGLLNADYPLNHIEHQRQYNEAACTLLGGGNCD